MNQFPGILEAVLVHTIEQGMVPAAGSVVPIANRVVILLSVISLTLVMRL